MKEVGKVYEIPQGQDAREKLLEALTSHGYDLTEVCVSGNYATYIRRGELGTLAEINNERVMLEQRNRRLENFLRHYKPKK